MIDIDVIKKTFHDNEKKENIFSKKIAKLDIEERLGNSLSLYGLRNIFQEIESSNLDDNKKKELFIFFKEEFFSLIDELKDIISDVFESKGE